MEEDSDSIRQCREAFALFETETLNPA